MHMPRARYRHDRHTPRRITRHMPRRKRGQRRISARTTDQRMAHHAGDHRRFARPPGQRTTFRMLQRTGHQRGARLRVTRAVGHRGEARAVGGAAPPLRRPVAMLLQCPLTSPRDGVAPRQFVQQTGGGYIQQPVHVPVRQCRPSRLPQPARARRHRRLLDDRGAGKGHVLTGTQPRQPCGRRDQGVRHSVVVRAVQRPQVDDRLDLAADVPVTRLPRFMAGRRVQGHVVAPPDARGFVGGEDQRGGLVLEPVESGQVCAFCASGQCLHQPRRRRRPLGAAVGARQKLHLQAQVANRRW
jgi:hypothetical protein